MAHFAEIDDNNIVLRVVVVSDEHEADGENWCNTFFGGGTWKQTSYNNNIRKNYAGIGYTFDASRDAFIRPKPFPSWLLVEDTCRWKAPIDMPDDGKAYEWDESITNWKET